VKLGSGVNDRFQPLQVTQHFDAGNAEREPIEKMGPIFKLPGPATSLDEIILA
jgi:hypothetical protein